MKKKPLTEGSTKSEIKSGGNNKKPITPPPSPLKHKIITKHILTEDEIFDYISEIDKIHIVNLAMYSGLNSHKCLDLISSILYETKIILFHNEKKIKFFNFSPAGLKKAVKEYNKLP